MGSNLIEPWDEEQEHDRLVAYTESQVLEPEPVYPGWMNLVAQRSVRAIAVAPNSRHIWMATWGGVLSWRQREESTYYRYSSEHGLACNLTACICVDEAERPWAGHEEGGLSYFDGHRWQVYLKLRTEAFRRVTSAGAGGGIWAATANTVYYIAGPDRLPRPIAADEEGALNATALLADGDDLLLGNSSGLFRVRRDGSLRRLAVDTIQACVALARDGAGRVWVGTPEAVYLMEDGESISPPIYDGRAGRVREIAAGKERAWLLTTAGISQMSDGQWQPVPLAEGQATAPAVQTIAASANDDYLWVGTDRVLSSLYYTGEGEAYWDHSLLPLHAEDELSNIGRCAAAAADGQVWIGTAGGLITYEPDDKWSAESMSGDVRALCVASFDSTGQARETLWLLSWPKGYSTLNQSARQPKGLPIALATGTDGTPYALTSHGLWRLGGGATLVVEGLPPSAHCLAETSDGAWWIGTTEGVYRYVAGECRLANERPGPLLTEVYALAVVDDVLWAATEAGLWSRAGQGWESHSPQQVRRVCALAATGDARKLWLAQEGAVVRYDTTSRTIEKEFTTAQHGLASCRVTALVESKGRLWIVTQAGVSRLELSEEEN